MLVDSVLARMENCMYQCLGRPIEEEQRESSQGVAILWRVELILEEQVVLASDVAPLYTAAAALGACLAALVGLLDSREVVPLGLGHTEGLASCVEDDRPEVSADDVYDLW